MKTSLSVNAVLALFSCTLLIGCATITGGTSQYITFLSNPEGAKVTLGGKLLGRTPLNIYLTKKGRIIIPLSSIEERNRYKERHRLTFKKEGYKKLSMNMETKKNLMFWGNIIIGGLPGSTTDDMTGAYYEYSPDQYMVTLEPIGTGPLDGPVSQRPTQKIKNLIIVGYDNLSKDLSRGSGPHLASLLKALNVPDHKKSNVISILFALSSTHRNKPEFADEVLRLFL